MIPSVMTAEPESENESKDEIDEEWKAGLFIHAETYVYLLICGGGLGGELISFNPFFCANNFINLVFQIE
jgi:hypothetical protein